MSDNVVIFPSKTAYGGFDTPEEMFQALRGNPLNQALFVNMEKQFGSKNDFKVELNQDIYEGADEKYLLVNRVPDFGTVVYKVYLENYTLGLVGVFDSMGRNISNEPVEANNC